MIMTFPEMASWYTMDRIKVKILNSHKVNLDANSVRLANSLVQNLSYGDRNCAANQLIRGFVVERHMEDGNVVLFNLQPLLHCVSIMAHRAVVMP